MNFFNITIDAINSSKSSKKNHARYSNKETIECLKKENFCIEKLCLGKIAAAAGVAVDEGRFNKSKIVLRNECCMLCFYIYYFILLHYFPVPLHKAVRFKWYLQKKARKMNMRKSGKILEQFVKFMERSFLYASLF